MLIKQFVRKNAFNGEVFLGKLFQEKVNARLVAEPRRSLWISNIHNWMEQKVLNLKLAGKLISADKSTELMLEECTQCQSSVKVFCAQFEKSRDRLLSLSNHVDG